MEKDEPAITLMAATPRLVESSRFVSSRPQADGLSQPPELANINSFWEIVEDVQANL